MPAVKFCGLRRPEDAATAVELGASYVGVIFAGGPRQVTAVQARDVLYPTRAHARAVGVFGALSPEEIARIVADAALDVVQLSADPDAEMVDAVRAATGAEVWAAVRCGTSFPQSAIPLFARADAVLLDAKVDGKLGGTGHTLPWADLAPSLKAARPPASRLVLAGGLTPENVAQAATIISPDVVDVSSGVESSPGIKDHQRMSAFVQALGL